MNLILINLKKRIDESETDVCELSADANRAIAIKRII